MLLRLVSACSLLTMSSANSGPASEADFVRVKGTQFVVGENDAPWYFIGTNFWAGMNLGSKGEAGDRERLVKELDKLESLGVKQLRIMGSSEGPDDEPWRVVPSLMPEPGVYNEDVLEGFDFFINEMSKRDMYAIVTLNNQWQWSGGYAQYIKWTEDPDGQIPYPAKGGFTWDEFQLYCNRFYYIEDAQSIYRNHIEFMVNRNNTFSGIPNNRNPTIMSWQLANEPRAHVRVDPSVAEVYDLWIKETSDFIKQMAPLQMISTGSEGDTPWDTVGNDLARNHRHESVGFATAHLWLMNWEFYHPTMSDDEFEAAIARGMEYVDHSIEQAASIGKPIVLEEFGFPRDHGSLNPYAEEVRRQQFYKVIFDKVIDSARNAGVLAGVNFWAWSGDGIPQMSNEDVPIFPPPNSSIEKCYNAESDRPEHCPEIVWWRPGDELTGDPPHETKGWYGVYTHDTSLLQLIQDSTTSVNTVLGDASAASDDNGLSNGAIVGIAVGGVAAAATVVAISYRRKNDAMAKDNDQRQPLV